MSSIKVKLEPQFKLKADKKKHPEPSTPTEKLTNPSIKQIDQINHKQSHVIDQSSKFFLPLDTSTSDLDETPTRKRSSSKNVMTQQQKKPKMVLSSIVPSAVKTVDRAKPHVDSDKVNTAVKQNSKAQVKEVEGPVTSSTPEKLKKVAPMKTNATVTAATTAPSMKPPPLFTPITTKILSNDCAEDTDKDDLQHAFQNVDDLMLKNEYIKVAAKPFDHWCEHGVSLVDRQYELTKNIIMARMKLNVKFECIFAKVNRYGLKLENKDGEIKDKLQKLQNLGEEIKAFITG